MMEYIVECDYSIIESIKKLFTTFKNTEYILIEDRYKVAGFSEDMSIIKTTELPEKINIPNILVIPYQSISTRVGNGSAEPPKWYIVNGSYIAKNDMLPISKYIIDNLIFRLIELKKSLFHYTSFSNANIFSIEDLRQDPVFVEKVLTMNSSSGNVMYIPSINSNYKMILYLGILPITKSDQVRLDIYEYPIIDSNSFIARFSIYKKNKMCIYVYIRFLRI